MRKFLTRGAVALLDNSEAAAVPADVAPADNANSLETDLTEVAESTAEGDAEEATIDEAVDTAEALEQYRTALEAYVAEGGMDSKTAHSMNIGLGYLTGRQGFSTASRPTLSLEHFDGASSRLRGTQAALESVSESIKKVWESIKAAIKRAIDWLKDHFNKIFGAAEKLQKRAAAIADKVKGGLGGTAKETKFENARLVKALHVGGTVPTNLSAAMGVAAKVAEDSFGHTADFGATCGQAILDGMNDTSGKVDDLGTMGYSAGVLKAVSAADATAGGFEAAPENMGLFRSEELPGGKAVLARYPTSTLKGQSAVDALSKTSAAVTAFNNKAPEVTKTDVPTLSGDEISKVATVVGDIAKAVIAYRAKADKANAMKAKVMAAADKLSKVTEKEEDKDKAAFMSAVQKLASASVSAIDKPAPQMAQYLLVTGKAALDLCEESIKQYGAK